MPAAGDTASRFHAGRILGLAGALTLGVAAIWLIATALLARSELSAAQAELGSIRTTISSGDLAATPGQAAQLRRHAHRAHQLTTGPVWWLAQRLPGLGEPLRSVRGCAAQADELSRSVLTPLADRAGNLTLSTLVSHGQVQLAPISAAAPAIAEADRQLQAAAVIVDELPHNTWLGSVDRRRADFSAALGQLQDQIHRIDTVTSLLPPMLGDDGPRRYFLGLENEAESRGVGGIPGAFAIVTVNQGQLSFSQFGNDDALYRTRTALDLGPEYDQRYAPSDPTNTYANSTISPDFSDAAQIWAAMWSKQSGQRVDGAIAIDPTAISYLLAVTGPAPLGDGAAVTAANVVALTQQRLYQTHPDTVGRKAYLLQIASAIAERLVTAPGSAQLVSAAAHGAAERRIVVWSADPSLEKTLMTTGVSGTLQAGASPFAGFSTVNATGGKLDYYLHRSMTYDRSGCGLSTPSTTVATFTLRSEVPPGPLPSYVTVREDKPPYPTRPGDDKVLVSYYATPGSQIQSVTLDGKAVIVVPGTEKGLSVFTVPVEIARGATAVLAVTLHEPPRAGPVQILRQPAVNPLSVSVHEPSCAE
jgi:HAMP domain-containing protein